MTPAAIIALIKDAVIVIALGAVAYMLITYGKDIVKVQDVKDLQKQLTHNAEQAAAWQKESTDADTKHVATLAQIAGTIDKQRTPVFVRGPSCPSAVPPDPGKAGGQPGASGTTDAGRGVDYRPTVNQFELKYETALADCYTALDKWPVVRP
jgi:hypothetical protein